VFGARLPEKGAHLRKGDFAGNAIDPPARQHFAILARQRQHEFRAACLYRPDQPLLHGHDLPARCPLAKGRCLRAVRG